MKQAIKPDGKEITPPTLEEIIGEIKKRLPPEGRGAFCRGDLIRILGYDDNEATNLVRAWRGKGLIEPAGKVTRINPWGDKKVVSAYRLVENEQLAD